MHQFCVLSKFYNEPKREASTCIFPNSVGPSGCNSPTRYLFYNDFLSKDFQWGNILLSDFFLIGYFNSVEKYEFKLQKETVIFQTGKLKK